MNLAIADFLFVSEFVILCTYNTNQFACVHLKRSQWNGGDGIWLENGIIDLIGAVCSLFKI